MDAKTQRESDCIGALALFYRNYDKIPYEQRIEAYSRKIVRTQSLLIVQN